MAGTNRCAPNLTPSTTKFAPGLLPGTNISSALPGVDSLPNQNIIDGMDRASGRLPAGYYPQIVALGGTVDKPNDVANQPNGDAASIQIVNEAGTVIKPFENPALYESFISGLVYDSLIDNRVTGIGMYDWGIQWDQNSWRQGSEVGVHQWNGSNGSTPDFGPQDTLDNAVELAKAQAAAKQKGIVPTNNTMLTDGSSGTSASTALFDEGYGIGQIDPALAAGVREQAKQSQAQCNPPPANSLGATGGCSPLSGFSLGSAFSMLGGLGLGIPTGLTGALGSFASSPMISQISSIAGQVTSLAAPALGLISNPLAQLSPGIAGQILGAGSGGVFNALSGKLPGPLATALGGSLKLGTNNILSGAIGDVANKVLGSGNLAKFSNVFNSALGGVGVAQSLGQSLNQVQSQVFGNAKNIIGDSLSVFTQFPGMNIGNMAAGQAVNLIGNQTPILQNLLGDKIKPLAAFGSVYTDFNSMVTQGMGSVTGNTSLLGNDLQTLGNLANLNDLLRIGTPGQIVEQLAVVGALAMSSTIANKLAVAGVGVTKINSPENDVLALEILGEINDKESIDDAFTKLNIRRATSNVASLADLTNKDFLFPESKDANNFENLSDISLHLAVCGAKGFKNLEEFGALLSSLESMSTDTNVTGYVMPVSMDEIATLKSTLSPTSEYSGDNSLTVADFIGSAAGYRHTETLPLMKTLLDELNANSITANYRNLNTLLNETLNGDYTVGSNIIVPTTAGYTFGTYSSLDDAAAAISNATDDELDVIELTASGDTLVALKTLQSYHDQVSYQLYHEHTLRKEYGININDENEDTEFFAGNGSTVAFTITGSVAVANSVIVYVDGVKQSRSKITYNHTTKVITFNTAPSNGAEIEVNYNNGNAPITGSVSDIWNFAGELENYGTTTGFGREADFLGRITTNDEHGSRIKATMLQARNRKRSEDAGMECPGYNRTLSNFYDENVNGVTNYADLTGIWSADPKRASEIYLQNIEDVTSREEYITRRIKANSFAQQPVFDDLMKKVSKQLIFYSAGSIAITNIATDMYTDFKDTYQNMYTENDSWNFMLNLNGGYPEQGYSIGPYKEIISEILRNESISNDTFSVPLSQQTKDYLKSIELDISKLVGVIQKTMLVNASNYLGLDENDVRSVFGMPGVGKYLLANIAD
jgi:hypothetical protein